MPGMLGVPFRPGTRLHDWSGVVATAGVLRPLGAALPLDRHHDAPTFGAKRSERSAARRATRLPGAAAAQPAAASRPRRRRPGRLLDLSGRGRPTPRRRRIDPAALRRGGGGRSRSAVLGGDRFLAWRRRRGGSARSLAASASTGDATPSSRALPPRAPPGRRRQVGGSSSTAGASRFRRVEHERQLEQFRERRAERLECVRPGECRHLGVHRLRPLPERLPGRRVRLGFERQSRDGAATRRRASAATAACRPARRAPSR